MDRWRRVGDRELLLLPPLLCCFSQFSVSCVSLFPCFLVLLPAMLCCLHLLHCLPACFCFRAFGLNFYVVPLSVAYLFLLPRFWSLFIPSTLWSSSLSCSFRLFHISPACSCFHATWSSSLPHFVHLGVAQFDALTVSPACSCFLCLCLSLRVSSLCGSVFLRLLVHVRPVFRASVLAMFLQPASFAVCPWGTPYVNAFGMVEICVMTLEVFSFPLPACSRFSSQLHFNHHACLYPASPLLSLSGSTIL